MSISPDDLLTFWFDNVGEPGWFGEDESLDRTIHDRFGPTWEAAVGGDLVSWRRDPHGALALAILLDQLPRNMFRGTPRAFASDPQARGLADAALMRDWDLAVTERERMFLYFPFGHSEGLADQDRALRLVEERMPILEACISPMFGRIARSSAASDAFRGATPSWGGRARPRSKTSWTRAATSGCSARCKSHPPDVIRHVEHRD